MGRRRAARREARGQEPHQPARVARHFTPRARIVAGVVADQRQLGDGGPGDDLARRERSRVAIAQISVDEFEAGLGERHRPVRKADEGVDEHAPKQVVGEHTEDDHVGLPAGGIQPVAEEGLIDAVAGDAEVEHLHFVSEKTRELGSPTVVERNLLAERVGVAHERHAGLRRDVLEDLPTSRRAKALRAGPIEAVLALPRRREGPAQRGMLGPEGALLLGLLEKRTVPIDHGAPAPGPQLYAEQDGPLGCRRGQDSQGHLGPGPSQSQTQQIRGEGRQPAGRTGAEAGRNDQRRPHADGDRDEEQQAGTARERTEQRGVPEPVQREQRSRHAQLEQDESDVESRIDGARRRHAGLERSRSGRGEAACILRRGRSPG